MVPLHVLIDTYCTKAGWLVANTPFLEMTKLLNQKGGSDETRELDLYWKSRQAFSTLNMELKFEFSP